MNNYKGIKIEFHILQSFPVTCLNRDDVGSPKTAVVGGVTRARVSSQAWKRQVRLAMRDFGISLAVRTKHIAGKVERLCIEQGATQDEAKNAGVAIANMLSKDTLHFFSETEARSLAEYAKEIDYALDEKNKPQIKEVFNRHKNSFKKGIKSESLDGYDIALFGRMVALSTDLNIEGAVSFSHAISTHKIANELEFFTALDDEKEEDSNDSGSSHMGSLEFNSATYYRYVSMDLGQLIQTLEGDEYLEKAIEAFVKALYVAVPYGRQGTQSGSNLWDYAKVYVRKGQRLQASFDAPIKSKGEGFLKPSIVELQTFLEKKEKMSGSLFGKINSFEWGLDENYSIDKLVEDIFVSIKE